MTWDKRGDRTHYSMIPKAVILAGGLSKRMGGGNKCLKELGGTTLLHRVINRLAPQTSDLALNCNDEPSLFLDYDLSILPDVVPDFVGPLAGILTAMEWARRNWPDEEWVMTAPVDMPFLPRSLAEQLDAALVDHGGADLIAPANEGRVHYLCGLWNLRQTDELRHAITKENLRAVRDWVARLKVEAIPCVTSNAESFVGLNTPAELDAAKKMLEQAS